MINLFLLRLPGLIFLINAYNVLIFALYNDTSYLYRSYLFLVLFAILMVIKERVDKKAVNILSRLTLCFALILIDLFIGDGFSLITSMFIGIVTLYSFFWNKYDYEDFNFSLHLVMIAACFVLLFSFVSVINRSDEIITLTYLFAMNFIVVLIDRYVCKFHNNRVFFIYSFDCRNSSLKTIFSMIKHTSKLFAIFIIAVAIVGALPMLVMKPKYNNTAVEAKQQIMDVIDSNINPGAQIDLPSSDADNLEITDDELAIEQDRDTRLVKAAPNYVQIIIIVLIFCAIVTLSVFAYRKAPKEINAFKDFDEGVDDSELVLEKKKRVHGVKPPNTNKAVRAMFVRKVNTHRKAGIYVDKSHTSRTIAGNILEIENIDTLEKLYIKARYSGETVDRDELNRLKKMDQ